jgi:hypothetical protein
VAGLPAEAAGIDYPRIEYDSAAGCPVDVAGGSYEDRVQPADVAPAAPAGFSLKAYSAK